MHPTYEQHLLGRLLPPMAPDDFQRLAADIAAHGLLEEIVLYQGTILDGWSRYRACQARGIKPRFREFTSADPVAYVLSKNVQRRHLSVVQGIGVSSFFGLRGSPPTVSLLTWDVRRAWLPMVSSTTR